jgi:filamentous hemagglutinin family protein
MNRDRYRTIFNKRLGMLVAVAETARSRRKSSGGGLGSSARVARRRGKAIGMAPVALAVGFALWGEAAFAGPPLPTGGVVTNGAGTISESGNTLTVNQSSQNLAANWQSFDIAADHAVVFNQPNSSAVALNRVIGPDASSIYGSLSANGKVFLVNPNGVLFAPGSQVSVGGLAAATLAISDEDFAAGRYRFTNGTGAGSVVNQGNIKADSVALIAPKVINSGTISTPGGNTTFAAGDRVTVRVLDGLLTAEVDASVLNAEIQNHGQIVAEGGSVSMLAGRADTVLNSLINTDGVVQANSIRSENGKIYLDAGAGGTAYVNGTLDASAANGSHGGEVRVLGERVTLGSGATVDVSSQRSGGMALIGGGYQGKNPDVLNARATTVEAGAAIRADGGEQGGRVIVWSDDTTRFEGAISARGKGFAEVSGKGTLRFSGEVDTGGGTLLLDPTNITVQVAAGDQDSTFSGGQIATLLGSNDVILNADNNITWNAGAALDYNGIGSTGRTLTLQAGNNIAYSGTISDSVAGGDTLSVVFNADRDASGVGGINIANSSSILTSGGDIVLRGGNSALSTLPAFTDGGYESALRATAARGITIGSATLNAGGGTIAARAVGVDGIANGVGVSLVGAALQTNGSGAITIDGIGGAGTTFNRGIFTSAANLSTVNGALTLQGIGSGSASENSGVRFNTGSTIQTTGSGNLIVNALGSTGGDFNDGVVIDGATVRVNTGDLSITGTGRGTGLGSDGVELANSSVVEATSSGNVSLNGTSIATGSNTNRGVTVWLSSTVRAASGALTLQGVSANPAKGAGISLEASGTIGGAGQSGNMTLTADTMNLSSSAVRGTGTVLLQPLTSTTSIGLGNSATGTLNLTSAELGLLQNGFSSITVGRADSSGAVDVRTAAFLDPVTIRTPVGSGSIAVNGTLSTGAGTSAGSISLQAAGDVSLNNGTVSTTDAINLTGSSYTVTGSSALTSNTLAFGNTNGVSDTGTLTLSQTVNTTIANAIGGTGGNLVKLGANTLTLTGNNAYSGTTTISAGTLQVGSGGTTGTLGTGAVTNNGTLTFNRSDALTQAGVIGGTGNLVKLGAGTVTLSGANTYSGSTTISTGTLALQNTNSSPSYSIASGAVLEMNVASGTRSMPTATFTGAGTLRKTGAGQLQWGLSAATFALSSGALIDVQQGTFIGGSSANEVWLNNLADLNVASGATFNGVEANVRVDALTGGGAISSSLACCGYTGFTFGVDGGSGTFSGVLSGLNFIKAGNGTQVLTGANTYTGTTAVNGGTLAITNANGLGTTAGGTTVASGATLDLQNVAVGAESVTLSNGTLSASTGTSSLAGPVILAAAGFNRFDVAAGAELTVSGVISGSGDLAKFNQGTLVLTAANTYTGATNVNAGTLQVGNGGTSGKLGDGLVTVASGADLVFNRSDSVSLSAMVSNAGGIAGAGDVTALIGGGFTVDRPIALSGANSSILLEAGKNIAAGDASGGDVTLTSNISTSASGTITIFSGNASTAAYEANVSGATGATRYKTYDASASDTSGAISGTRNYYYRQQPSTLTVSGLTASKVYDGLLDATAALDGSAASVLGLIDGDTLSYDDLTVTGASFDSAHAGTRALNVSFAGDTPSYTGGGAAWSVSGYGSLGNYSNATAGTITPRVITVAIDGAGKTYDGLTSTTSTLGAPAGFVGNDNAASVSGLLLSFDNPNAGTRNVVASGTGTLNGFIGAAQGNGSGSGAGNEVAGLASDYTVATPSPVSAAIAQAPLSIIANDDTKIITQSDAAGYNGASFSGFVNGESAADLSGSLTITRSNTGTESAGTYAGVLTPTGLTSGNYAITFVNGDYQILPAQQLLIRIQNLENDYGSAAGYVVASAEYLDDGGATIHTLTPTAQSGNTYTFSDGLGGGVTFTIAPENGTLSGAGYLAAGNYSLTGSNASIAGNNFIGLNYAGNQTVNRVGLAPSASGVTKVYDGTTAMSGLMLDVTGMLAGDAVTINGSGAFSSRNAGTNLSYDVNGLALSGADAGNYYLSVGGFSGTDGTITPRSITVTGIAANDRVYDGTTVASLVTTGAALNGVVLGDSATLDAASYSALFGDKNVGAVKAVSVTGLGLSGADAGNYILTQPMDLTASITPATLTVNGLSANDRVYDGTTVASLVTTGAALNGVVLGDSATLDAASYSALFGDKNVGAVKEVSVTGLGLSGADAGNYILTQPMDLTASITPATLTVNGLSANDRVYDGTTTATLTTAGAALNGVVLGDSATLDAASYSALFGDKNVGAVKAVSVTGLGLSGADAGNYILTQPMDLTASITPATLTVNGLSANDRVYDGTTTATLTTTGAALNGVVLGDSATLDAASYSALFGDKNVGAVKEVSVTGLGLSGTDAGNYILTQPTGLTASITPRPLTITAGTNIKYYDATTGAAATPTLSGALVGSDSFALLGEQYAAAEVGTGLTLIPLAVINDGNGGNNYAVTFVNDTTGTIQMNPADVAEDVGSSAASGLEDTVAAAGRSDRVRVQGKRDEVCVADDSRNCVVGEISLSTPQVISTGIRLPQGVTTTSLDATPGVRW